jgi:hypothetical protein
MVTFMSSGPLVEEGGQGRGGRRRRNGVRKKPRQREHCPEPESSTATRYDRAQHVQQSKGGNVSLVVELGLAHHDLLHKREDAEHLHKVLGSVKVFGANTGQDKKDEMRE